METRDTLQGADIRPGRQVGKAGVTLIYIMGCLGLMYTIIHWGYGI